MNTPETEKERIRTWGSGFLPQHVAMFEASAIEPAVVKERQYRSVTEKSTLERAGFSGGQRNVPGLLVTMWSVTGESCGYQYRPDSPRMKDGRPVKYETRPEQRNRIDVHPRILGAMADPTVDLWITEGSKKADAAISAGVCCVALTGVWNWRTRNKAGGKVASPDFESIALNGRKVVLAFDSDYREKRSVWDALNRLAEFLTSRGAEVHFAHFSDAGDGKVGLDDYIAANGREALSTLPIDREIGPRPVPPAERPVAVDGLNMTDAGNSERLIAAHGDELHFVPEWKKWIVWNEIRWVRDDADVRTIEKAKSIGRGLWESIAEAPPGAVRDASVRWAKASESANAIGSAVRLARGLPGVPIEFEELDADPWHLNAENGIVDLRTGELRPHEPERLMTKVAGARYERATQALRWERFIESILPDPEVRRYVQRAVGYSATGLTTEQVMFLLIGNGSNGKSTFVNAITAALGDYAGPVSKDLLIQQRNDNHPTSFADLFRLRFAVAMETEATASLAEAKVKSLTGSDPIKARRMAEDWWHFEPTHKLWLAANYLPKITGTDHGIWRRIRVVPFVVQFDDADRDPNLPAALADELPGILRWIVDGAIAWQTEGFEPPAGVQEATEKYREDSDWFVQFCEECGWVVGEGGSTTAKELNESLRMWANANAEPVGRNILARELTGRGCRQSRSGSARAWLGIRKSEDFQQVDRRDVA